MDVWVLLIKSYLSNGESYFSARVFGTKEAAFIGMQEEVDNLHRGDASIQLKEEGKYWKEFEDEFGGAYAFEIEYHEVLR